MRRRYDYKCLECGDIFEICHDINDRLSATECSTCSKIVFVEKLITNTSFKINWNTNY